MVQLGYWGKNLCDAFKINLATFNVHIMNDKKLV